MLARVLSVRQSLGTFVVATALVAAPLSGQLAVGAHLNPGANSRGYIDERTNASGQTFTSGCATAGFLPGFDEGTMPLFDLGNRTISEATGCTHSGWTGTSIMNSAPRTIRSYTSVTVNDPATLFGNDVNGLLALSRASFLDAVTISSAGAVPDSVSFAFSLDGSLANAPGVNSVAVPSANFFMAWDTDVSPGFSFDVQPSGAYYFAFAVAPDMLDRPIQFSITLQTFATLFAVDGSNEFSGSATTDYGNTLTVDKVSFLDALGTGPGQDITGSVDATFQSGANYTAALPEPSAIVLVASGFAALGVVAKRRRRQ